MDENLVGQIFGAIIGLFLFSWLFQLIWNVLAGQFGFAPITNYWVAFVIWICISFAIGIIYSLIHGMPQQ